MVDNAAKYAAIATAAAAAAALIAIRARRGTAEAIQAAASRAAQDAAQSQAEELDDTPAVPERAILLMLNSDSVVSVARQLSTASDLVSFLASSKALVELMPCDVIQTLWRTMAVQRFPRIQALAAALQSEDYRRLYRAQLLAERERHRPDTQVNRAISEYVFTVELYSCTAGEPEDVFGAWTGRFVQELSCNVWQPDCGPAWTQLPTVQRNQTTNLNDLNIRVTVTKLSPHMGISTLIL